MAIRTGLTIADYEALPGSGERYELIDGELALMEMPLRRHQRVVRRLLRALDDYAMERGGEAFTSPFDVYIEDRHVLQPDVLYLAVDHPDLHGSKELRVPPTLVAEVSSPSTKRRDLGRKRELYAQLGVPEHWFVDLDLATVRVVRLTDGRYDLEELVSGTLTSPPLPGFAVEVGDLLVD